MSQQTMSQLASLASRPDPAADTLAHYQALPVAHHQLEEATYESEALGVDDIVGWAASLDPSPDVIHIDMRSPTRNSYLGGRGWATTLWRELRHQLPTLKFLHLTPLPSSVEQLLNSMRNNPVGKPKDTHVQVYPTMPAVARSADALARPAANNMPLSEHDTQELRRLLYLKAEGIERQERLQYLRQTWKSSICSEEDDESYTLPDPEIPLVYSLHYGQQCPPEWDDGSVPAETADRQKKKEHGKSNLHAEEDFLQKLESLNLDPRLKKPLITYEEVFGALPPPLSCKKLVQMDLKLKPEFEKTRVRRRPYPAPQEQVEEIERQIQECIDAGLVEEYKQGDYPHHCSP